MEEVLENLAKVAEQGFEEGLDWSDEGALGGVCYEVLDKLDDYQIGPAVLSLLVVFAFPEGDRERIWREINQVVKDNR